MRFVKLIESNWIDYFTGKAFDIDFKLEYLNYDKIKSYWKGNSFLRKEKILINKFLKGNYFYV